jgi:hypothetical protein
LFALVFEGRHSGRGIGGSFGDPMQMLSTFTRTGRRWHSDGTHRSAVAVGPTGTDLTRDGGHSWTGFGPMGFEDVMCAPDGTCWASDEHGGVARLSREHDGVAGAWVPFPRLLGR